MKNIVIALFMVIGLVSCKEDEIDLYSGSAMISTNFAVPGDKGLIFPNSVNVPFGSTPELNEQQILMQIHVNGYKSTSERVAKFEITGDANIEDYDIPTEVKIPANSLLVEVNITIHRPQGTDEGRTNLLTIKVVENSDFMVGPTSVLTVDYATIPSNWVGPGKGMAEMVLGKCSKLKYQIYFDAVGSFDVPGGYDVWNAHKVPAAYLEKYNNNPEEYDFKYGSAPVKDENGVISFSGI